MLPFLTWRAVGAATGHSLSGKMHAVAWPLWGCFSVQVEDLCPMHREGHGSGNTQALPRYKVGDRDRAQPSALAVGTLLCTPCQCLPRQLAEEGCLDRSLLCGFSELIHALFPHCRLPTLCTESPSPPTL